MVWWREIVGDFREKIWFCEKFRDNTVFVFAQIFAKMFVFPKVFAKICVRKEQTREAGDISQNFSRKCNIFGDFHDNFREN